MRLLSLCCIILFVTNAKAFESENIRQRLRERIDQQGLGAIAYDGPICGVYAGCRLAGLVSGIEPIPSEFLTVKYISQRGGSTSQDLRSLLDTVNIDSTSISNITKLDLLLLRLPFIALVKSDAADRSAPYNHWITAIPGLTCVEVYDGPAESVSISYSEFLQIWIGHGIFATIEREPIYVTVVACRIAFVLFAVSIIVFVVRSAESNRRKRFCYAFAFSSICGTAAFGPGICPKPVEDNFEERDLVELFSQNDSTDRILIDARINSTFKKGAFEDAINIPVNASAYVVRKIFSDVNRDTPILVYCHSANCEFDRVVAKRLRQLGFTNIVLGATGWVEWCLRDDALKS